MKVINISYDDYANFAYNNARALASVGVEVTSIKLKKHPFNYKEESQVVTIREMVDQCNEADIVQMFHTHPHILALAPRIKPKKVVYHTGTIYRREPKEMNLLWNPLVEMCFTDQCEFLFLGAKKLKYIAAAIDTEAIQATSHASALPYRFAHFPSKPEVKGSHVINKIMNSLRERYLDKMRYTYSDMLVNHKKQLQRMASCDIYIELHQHELEGKPYGCYGVTAFEAAALGKIVITDNIFPNVYPEAYGCKLPFITPHSERNLMEEIEALISKPIYEIRSMQQSIRQWVVKNHSYQATGSHLKTILQSLL